MTEPIDQATKKRIEKEAEAFSHRSMSDAEYVSILSPKGCYIAGATVWAEKLKQERNKVIDEFYNLMDKELQTEPINRARYMNRLFEFKESLKDKSHE